MAEDAIPSQVRLVIESHKAKIARAIIEKLAQISQIKYLSFDKIKLLASDFQEHEIPAVQLIDVNETVEHEQNRAKKTWSIALELVMKSSANLEINQNDLWNLAYEIERKLWAEPNLNVKGVIHMVYRGNSTDLHLLEPFYLMRLDFDVQYYQPLVRPC